MHFYWLKLANNYCSYRSLYSRMLPDEFIDMLPVASFTTI